MYIYNKYSKNKIKNVNLDRTVENLSLTKLNLDEEKIDNQTNL